MLGSHFVFTCLKVSRLRKEVKTWGRQVCIRKWQEILHILGFQLHEPKHRHFHSNQSEVKTLVRQDTVKSGVLYTLQRFCLPPPAPVPSVLRDSSILISFFFTFRVELTSLWSLLKAADSSCSPSDRSQDCQESSGDGKHYRENNNKLQDIYTDIFHLAYFKNNFCFAINSCIGWNQAAVCEAQYKYVVEKTTHSAWPEEVRVHMLGNHLSHH